MKKSLIILLIMLMAFGVMACSNVTKDNKNDIKDNKEIEKEINEISNYDKISEFMEAECRNAFSPYYELLEFEIFDYKEEVQDENIEATFSYRMIHKNYDRDPDTVRYIKEAKESGNPNYKQMYDEYLQPREMNFHLKVIIDKNSSITLYSNIAPKGIEWEETKMTDFILK